MILTLNIPDTLADRLRAEAAACGEDLNHYAVAKLEQPPLEMEEDEEDPDTDLIAALRAGIVDRDAGCTVSLEEMDTRIQGVLRERGERPADYERKAD